jgi:L-ribulose-5-phosphate 4-epimerase
MLEELKQQVLSANRALVDYGLVTLTWGNVSGIDRSQKLVVIKPSGVDYDRLTVEQMTVVDLKGRLIEGSLRPSSDTPTHLELYNAFPGIGGVAHTHSDYATAFAQAGVEIPCLGTTHADHFWGTIPLTRMMTEMEIEGNYEANTGRVIIERMTQLDPLTMPGILVAGHGPFTWGSAAMEALRNSLILERVARLAYRTYALNPEAEHLPVPLLLKHFSRKSGPNAYYGQTKNR